MPRARRVTFHAQPRQIVGSLGQNGVGSNNKRELDMQQIAFIGLGAMGKPIAERLLLMHEKAAGTTVRLKDSGR